MSEKSLPPGEYRPPFLDLLGAEIVKVDHATRTCEMTFQLGREFCHSVDIVQGGFVTAMLDATASHAVFLLEEGITVLSTLEIKVSFFEACRAGKFHVTGKIERIGKSIAFMSGEIRNGEGTILAATTTTAKIIRKK